MRDVPSVSIIGSAVELPPLLYALNLPCHFARLIQRIFCFFPDIGPSKTLHPPNRSAPRSLPAYIPYQNIFTIQRRSLQQPNEGKTDSGICFRREDAVSAAKRRYAWHAWTSHHRPPARPLRSMKYSLIAQPAYGAMYASLAFSSAPAMITIVFQRVHLFRFWR